MDDDAMVIENLRETLELAKADVARTRNNLDSLCRHSPPSPVTFCLAKENLDQARARQEVIEDYLRWRIATTTPIPHTLTV